MLAIQDLYILIEYSIELVIVYLAMLLGAEALHRTSYGIHGYSWFYDNQVST